MSAPCILAAARRPESGRSHDLRGIEHNAIMRKGGRGVLPQDSKSLRLPFSLKERDSLESTGAIDIARTLTISASKVLLGEVGMVAYNAFRTS